MTTIRLMALLRITASSAAKRNAPMSNGNLNSAPPSPMRPPSAPMAVPPTEAKPSLRAFNSLGSVELFAAVIVTKCRLGNSPRCARRGSERRRDRRAVWEISGGIPFSAEVFGGGGRNRTGVDGFAGRCMTTLPPRPGCRPTQPSRSRSSEKGEPHAIVTGSPSRSWSGKRVSNSRPQPWQGCALPTELFPRCTTLNYSELRGPVKIHGDESRIYRITSAIASAT